MARSSRETPGLSAPSPGAPRPPLPAWSWGLRKSGALQMGQVKLSEPD